MNIELKRTKKSLDMVKILAKT